MKVRDMNEKELARYNEYNRKKRESNWHKKYHIEHREHRLQYSRNYNAKIRKTVLDYYSDGKLECACCGEKQYEFLTLDHINGGNKHRNEQKLASGNSTYLWAIRNGFPPIFQVLCFNCNCTRKWYKECPHKAMKKINAELKRELK